MITECMLGVKSFPPVATCSDFEHGRVWPTAGDEDRVNGASRGCGPRFQISHRELELNIARVKFHIKTAKCSKIILILFLSEFFVSKLKIIFFIDCCQEFVQFSIQKIIQITFLLCLSKSRYIKMKQNTVEVVQHNDIKTIYKIIFNIAYVTKRIHFVVYI